MAELRTKWPAFVWATAAFLMILSASELLVKFASSDLAALSARAAFVGLCLTLMRTFAMREWVLLTMAMAVGIVSVLFAAETRDLIVALDRAAFFAAFIYLVTLLKQAAERSDSVLDMGRYVTGQSAGRRYYSLAAGGHIMGVLLNFGAVSLLTPMILRGVRASSNDPQEIIQLHRQQISALIRGFAWMIMWSPTALTQVVLFTAFPTINLFIVLPLGIFASITMVFIGRAESRWNAPETVSAIDSLAQPFPQSSGITFGLICAAIITLTFVTAFLFDVSAALGLMLVAPVFTAGWIFAQAQSEGLAQRTTETVSTITAIVSSSATTLGRSAFVLGAAGFIGEAAARLLPVESFADQLGIATIPDWLFLMLLPVLITIGGQIALSPILVVVFMSAIINQLPVLPADPNLIVFSLGAGWAMSMTASPNASATLLISGIANIAPTTLTWRWNGLYSLLCFAAFCIMFAVLTWLLPAAFIEAGG